MRRSFHQSLLNTLIGGAALIGLGAPSSADELVAIKAGTVHLVEGDQVLTGGATVLIRDGKIVAVGKDIEVPAGAQVVDYGPDAVIAPGLVAVDSGANPGAGSERTAAPGLRAVDGFDTFTKNWTALRAGVTTMYLAPARGRLIAGQGAVVKSAGEPGDGRVVSASSGIHGSISEAARSTAGYWEPRLPATVDIGLGVEQQQLPGSTTGAIIALRELVAFGKGDQDLSEEYGPEAGRDLGPLLSSGAVWRMGAETPDEVRALLSLASELGFSLVIEGATYAGGLGDELAKAGVAVIYVPPAVSTSDGGKDEDTRAPQPDAASRLVAAGAKVAVGPSTGGLSGLRFALGQSRRGGMDEATALRAITLTAAEILGVADRVGSLAPGKDGDLAIFSGHPADPGSGVLATWVDGEVIWKAKEDRTATVVSVDELYLGDGHVLSPGEVLLMNGRVMEVGQRVSRPRGCAIVRGGAAMPGAIDMLGYLGLEGSDRAFSTRFNLARIIDPGDATDRRVARAGVTTVNLGSRSARGTSPTMAYRPASENPNVSLLRAPASVRMAWSNQIPSEVGKAVREALKKAAEYKLKWEEYEKAIATWKPDPPKADEESDEEAKDDEKPAEEEKEEKPKKPKKRKKGEAVPAVPATGTWEGDFTSDSGETRKARLRIDELAIGGLESTLRAEGSNELIVLEGDREEYAVALEGWVEDGKLRLELTEVFDEKDETIVTLEGTVNWAGTSWNTKLARTSEEFPRARRPEKLTPKPESAPKGRPKSPGINPDLEPLRQAMMGSGAVIVSVDRADQVVDCVNAFAEHGIKPILFGASGAGAVANQISGRVAGVLPGSNAGSRYNQLVAAGIPVGFYSTAEEGAAGLFDVVSYQVASGFSAGAAVRALTGDAARMLGLDNLVGLLAPGRRGDVVLLDGPPLMPSTRVLRVWVDGKEVH